MAPLDPIWLCLWLNLLLKFVFCEHYSIHKEFFYYIRFLDSLFK